MISDTKRFHRAMDHFDTANSEDPRKETVKDIEYPKELLYAQRMTSWLTKLYPDASEALQLAARCQHIRRWTISRDTYPMDKVGYLRWRQKLKEFHAHTASAILQKCGYDEATISRVQSLLRKEKLKYDAEVQALEDVVCLVFLENYFTEFSKDHNNDKLGHIIRKMWKKLSPKGRQSALQLKLPPDKKSFLIAELAKI